MTAETLAMRKKIAKNASFESWLDFQHKIDKYQANLLYPPYVPRTKRQIWQDIEINLHLDDDDLTEFLDDDDLTELHQMEEQPNWTIPTLAEYYDLYDYQLDNGPWWLRKEKRGPDTNAIEKLFEKYIKELKKSFEQLWIQEHTKKLPVIIDDPGPWVEWLGLGWDLWGGWSSIQSDYNWRFEEYWEDCMRRQKRGEIIIFPEIPLVVLLVKKILNTTGQQTKEQRESCDILRIQIIKKYKLNEHFLPSVKTTLTIRPTEDKALARIMREKINNKIMPTKKTLTINLMGQGYKQSEVSEILGVGPSRVTAIKIETAHDFPDLKEQLHEIIELEMEYDFQVDRDVEEDSSGDEETLDTIEGDTIHPVKKYEPRVGSYNPLTNSEEKEGNFTCVVCGRSLAGHFSVCAKCERKYGKKSWLKKLIKMRRRERYVEESISKK